MMNVYKNIKDSWKHIPYTWKHYRAFLKTEKNLLGYYKYKFHDWDKLLMYIFMPYLGTQQIHKHHQNHRSHHLTSNKSISKINFEEAIIDWECARFTKPDKPLNARQTLQTYYSEYAENVIPILEKLGL